MYPVLTTLIYRLGTGAVDGAEVIPWSCPIPSFGDPYQSKVATLGINPSNREFVDRYGNELEGTSRRLHTLHSLGLTSWLDADARHLDLILETCRSYFDNNPYDSWFRKLDLVVSGADASYYDPSRRACHFDLIPFATERKWTELDRYQRSILLTMGCDTLGLILRDSDVRTLILNGSSVVTWFQSVSDSDLDSEEIPAWSLVRGSSPDVMGVAYKGIAETVSGVRLEREVAVLGFNHNIQGSFGVTTGVVSEIRRWVSKMIEADR